MSRAASPALLDQQHEGERPQFQKPSCDRASGSENRDQALRVAAWSRAVPLSYAPMGVVTKFVEGFSNPLVDHVERLIARLRR